MTKEDGGSELLKPYTVSIQGTTFDKRKKSYKSTREEFTGEDTRFFDLSGDESVEVQTLNGSTLVKFTFEGHLPQTTELQTNPIIAKSTHGEGRLVIKKK